MTVPGKMQSYLASGLPVIGMLDGEGARVITAAEAGETCAAGDSSGLAHIVSRLSRSSVAERQRMGRKGAAYAQQEFDRDRLLSRLEHLMRETTTALSTEQRR